MRQQFKDEMDANNKAVQEMVINMESVLTQRLDIFEKKHQYLLDSECKNTEEKLNKALE